MRLHVVDMEEFRSPDVRVYAGRERGNACRLAASLDEADAKGWQVEVRIPEDVFSLTTGFMLAMFGPSIRWMGEQDFRKRYTFKGWRPDAMQEILDSMIRYALNRSSPL